MPLSVVEYIYVLNSTYNRVPLYQIILEDGGAEEADLRIIHSPQLHMR